MQSRDSKDVLSIFSSVCVCVCVCVGGGREVNFLYMT